MNPTYKTNPIAYFDDTELKDEWQNEVYLYTKDIVEQNNYKNIVDFGCGSGYKLIKYFNEYNTIGIDLPPTISVLKERYPGKVWQDNLDTVSCDVFIASDVIEHMENPDILLDFIEKCNPKEIILSTPASDLRTPIIENGPPANIHHIREWSFNEFKNYIESRFQIINHKITNEEQHTQMIHAKLNTTDKEIANLFWHGELTNLSEKNT
jgi:SAM-dependent methyltransferase